LEAAKLLRREYPDIEVDVAGGIDIRSGYGRYLRGRFEDCAGMVKALGPLNAEQMAEELALKDTVTFVGHQDNVEEWLRCSKIFVLTSDSEGLAQAMIQGMLCGLPAVVSDVGDLGDLVNSGTSGYLIHELTPETFAACFIKLLKEPELLAQCGRMAYETAKKYENENVVHTWNKILKNLHDVT